jgi:hypothetical protein
MKLVGAFVAVLALGALAQSSGIPIVIKHEGCFAVMLLQFSPDGSELAQACGLSPIEMFDTTNYRKARTFRSEIDYTPGLKGFAYSPDGKTMATARGHGGAAIWNAADPGKPVTPPNGKPLKSFYGVDELYALDKPLHVLQPPTGSSDEFASVLSITYSPATLRVRSYPIPPTAPTRTKNFPFVSARLRSPRTPISSPSAPSKERCT